MTRENTAAALLTVQAQLQNMHELMAGLAVKRELSGPGICPGALYAIEVPVDPVDS